MDNRLVITIGRQCGSGGRRIGQMLAEQLGIKCYDKEILNRAAKESGLAAELFETHDEKPTSSFLYSLVMDMPINHKIFLAQFDTIKKLASEESCIIVGRCADYALADDPNAFSVFITGNDEDKIKRIMETNNIEANKAKDIMVKTDKKRSSYYNYYSSKRWADSRSYDLTVNSSTLGLEGSVELIKTFAKIKGLL